MIGVHLQGSHGRQLHWPWALLFLITGFFDHYLYTMTNSAEQITFPWDKLPKDILLEIFRKLPISDIHKCRTISKEFSKHLEDESFWKSLFFLHFTIDQNILLAMQKDSEFAFKKLFHTPKWDHRKSAHHPEISISNKGLTGGFTLIFATS